ncbi:MAG: sodium:calcium antiporter [Clostridia bacterium]|nr:sodium:calcium antiporter [Clostridia bacterium]
MINPWLQFLICAAIIIFAGSRLARNAAVVAGNIGIGTARAGALLLPLATSLPELVTTLRAVMIDAPDLAIGNILGSCLYNLTLLAVIDLLEGRGALTARINQGHIVTASLSIISICLVSIAMLRVVYLPIGWVGVETLFIALVYIFGSRLLYRYERKNLSLPPVGDEVHDSKNPVSTGQALLQFLIAAGLILIAGVFLTDASDQIAVLTGLGHTFVGSIFLAVSTSLPETVTTITAVRLGYIDMAVANVFGANFMNLFIVFLADLFYRRGPLLYAVSDSNLLSAVMVILLSTVIILGLTYRSKRKVARIGYDVLLVLAGYLVTVVLLFKAGGN